jgi:hypothetical protein
METGTASAAVCCSAQRTTTQAGDHHRKGDDHRRGDDRRRGRGTDGGPNHT